MADYDYTLRRQVSDLYGLTTQLSRTLVTVGNQVADVGNGVAIVGGQVAAVDSAQQQTRAELAQLSTEFLAFVLKAERTANIQRAETRIGALENRLDIEFGRYGEVRRTAAGLVRAFDSGLVKQETVETATELLMLQNPRYWLAPAVIGLGAWSGGDSVMCDEAIAQAYALAPSRTALLFALILRRQERRDSSVRWLRHYLDKLDPKALSREFAVMLESIAQGAFGAGGRALIRDTTERWDKVFADDEAAQDAQVTRWRFEIDQYIAAEAGDSFGRLRAHSPQWPELALVLTRAEAHQPFMDHYRELLAAEYTPTALIEDAIDDILDILVSEYDVEELPMRRELAVEHAVIAHEGDLDAAKVEVDAGLPSLGATLDYLTVKTSAALDPEAIGVSAATQQVALASCVDWAERAHGSFCVDYRTQYPADVEVGFPEQTPIGPQFTLPQWTGSLTRTPMPQLESSLGAHWDSHTAPVLAGLEFNLSKALIKPGAITAVVLIIGLMIQPVLGVLAAAAVFGIWYVVINQRRTKAELYRKQVADLIASQKQQALVTLRATGAEYVDYQSRYRRADEKEQEARDLIASFAAVGGDKTPHEGRTVLNEPKGAGNE